MKIKEIVAFCSLFNALCFTSGFTATNRSEWSAVPQLKPRPQVSVEVLMKDARARGIDDALRSSEEKKSLKRENVTIARRTPSREKSDPEHQTNLVVDLMTGPEVRFDQREKFAKGSGKNEPLNVILLLIDGLDDAEEDLKMHLENPDYFPTQGFLLSCPEKPNTEPEAFYFAERSMNCDCEDLLRSNIVALLSWAQHEREMSTSALYEMPTVYSRRIETDSPVQVRRVDRQRKASKTPSSRTEPRKSRHAGKDKRSSSLHEEGHVSGVLSRLREAFFRTLLKSLGSSEQDEQKRRSFPPRGYSNFRELAARTLEELNSMPNERGYVLLATSAASELPGALELLRLYVSPLNTLVIVTSPCPRDKFSLVPFFARGPHSEDIIEANPSSLQEIPSVIRGIISRSHECRGSTTGCENAFPATVQPSLLTFEDPILILSDEEIPVQRFARDERVENKTHQKLKRSEKEQQQPEKVVEAKKPRETKAITAKRTDEARVTVWNIDETSKAKSVPLDVEIQLRMGDESRVKNSQATNLPSTLVFVTILTVLTTFASEY
ncbi:hypothetical protein TSAR_001017 [Trichomalopsis sarcophagae]|uniref:Uncharacterized protein n=1 Tax=Trichomalopsis sarcophagae TaxID=543379 RepID=A0A232ELQ0_9HYME|nr:hypothetical protein TSAR_001017 [Trichomalopsis sarcophagae]